jgi:hypothetical protein
MAAEIKESKLKNRAKDLLLYTFQATKPKSEDKHGFPKSAVHTYIRELRESTISIMKHYISANNCMFETEYNLRIQHIRAILTECDYMEVLLETALELGYIDSKKCAFWSRKMLDVKYMAAAWKKTDSARAEKLLKK